MNQTSIQAGASRRRTTTAFTLVELLVVIGIIALLVSILLPALNRARESGNLVKCQANLRTIGQAMMIYTNANKGTLPYGFNNLVSTDVSDWTTLLTSTLASQRNAAYGQENYAEISHNSRRQMFVCPSAYLDPTAKNTVLTHYVAHPRLLPDVAGIDYAKPIPRPNLAVYKIARVKRSAEIAIIFDGSLTPTQNYVSTACARFLDNNAMAKVPAMVDDYTRITPAGNADTPVNVKPGLGGGNPPENWFNSDRDENFGNIRFRHTKDTAANCLMVDGHVATFKFNKQTKITDLKRRNIYVNE